MNCRPLPRRRLVRLCLALPALLSALSGAVAAPPARAADAASRGAAQDVADLDRVLAQAAPGRDSVFVGDMGLRVDALRLYRQRLADRLAGRVAPRSSFLPTFSRWPGGGVPYAFDANVSPANRAAFVQACGDWEAVANVHFFPRTTEADYVLVHAAAFNNSYVGRIGGPQDLNLYNFDYEFVMAHEIGHALGLIHEQERSDRDQYVTVETRNIASGMLPNFAIVPGSLNQGAYDFDSVMHYGPTAFSANGQPTLVVNAPYAATGVVLGQHSHLSAGDKAGMAALYGPPAAPAPPPLPAPAAAPVARVLWSGGSGTLSLWDVDGAGGFTHREAGPYQGWTPEAVAAGPDQRARVLWDHSSGAMSLWDVNPDGGFGHTEYGPYAGWTARSLAVGPDNTPRILWTHVTGALSLWTVNADGGFGHAEYGPYGGWAAQALAAGPDGRTQVLWAQAGGMASLWNVNTDGSFSYANYGPYSGWSAQGLAAAPDGTRRVLWTHTSGQASVWHVDAGGGFTHAEYGPYPAWATPGINVGADGVTRLLWAHPGGEASLWSLDAAGGFAYRDYGPYAGWAALSLGGG
jgi:hypothetical protein